MYPLVGFASQAQRYVSKGRRFLSDAPFGPGSSLGIPGWILASWGFLAPSCLDSGFWGFHVRGSGLNDQATSELPNLHLRGLRKNKFYMKVYIKISRQIFMPRRVVTGGPPWPPVLSLYPFGIKEGPKGTSLAMYPLVGFAFQAQGYVNKGRRFLSDAPFGWFP